MSALKELNELNEHMILDKHTQYAVLADLIDNYRGATSYCFGIGCSQFK